MITFDPANKRIYKFLFASSIGTFLEFFDLALYSFCAVLIAKYFFPPDADSSIAEILTWLIFAVSYVVRPFGAVWFGNIADRHSSKRAMVLSMSMMAFATCGIGLLPTYEQIGLLAPVLLLILRITQSVAVSPEYNILSVFVKNNNWCAAHYGLVSSISASITGLGMLSASWLMSKILGNASLLDIPQYAWRLPFVIAGLLVGTIGIYLRWNIDDTLTADQPKTVPIRAVLQKQFKDLLQAIIIAGYIGVITYVLFSFLVYQLQHVRHMNPGDALAILGFGSLILPTFSLLAGYCSDYVPRNILMLAAACVIVASGFSLFSNLSIVSEHAILIQASFMLAGLGFFAGGFPGYLAELFAHEYRYTGSFVAYNIGMSWIGGISPLLFIGLAKIHAILPVWLIASYSLLVIALLVQPLLSFKNVQTDIV
ncbi:MAG TPA: MFS transporter [Gammaproteobacteria bacterium]|nr:MFS transporter [Gammaproteobacteria bacterium]